MPRPYSTDLRERVLTSCERGEGTREEIAGRFQVAVSTLYLWLRATRAEGRRGPKSRVHSRAPIGGKVEALVELVAEQSDATLAEYAERLAARTGTRRSLSAVCRALKAFGLVRKKRHSGPPSKAGQMLWPLGRGGAPSWPRSLPSASSSSTLDSGAVEGIDTRLTRTHARAAKGQRALGKVPCGHWRRLTVIGALAHDGMVASMSIAAATSTAVFLAFVEQAESRRDPACRLCASGRAPSS